MNEKIKQLADPVVIIADVMNRKRMNETIKILMYEANKSVNPGAWTLADFSEKFAELIVKECADACYKHKDVESFGIYPVRVAMVTKACSYNIKEHFGVEE